MTPAVKELIGWRRSRDSHSHVVKEVVRAEVPDEVRQVIVALAAKLEETQAEVATLKGVIVDLAQRAVAS